MQYDYKHYDYTKYKGFEIWRGWYVWNFNIRKGNTKLLGFKKIEEAKDFIDNL